MFHLTTSCNHFLIVQLIKAYEKISHFHVLYVCVCVCARTHVYMCVIKACIFQTKLWKPSRRPMTDEQISKLYICTVEYYETVRKRCNLSVCCNLDGTRGYHVKEIRNQDKYWMISFISKTYSIKPLMLKSWITNRLPNRWGEWEIKRTRNNIRTVVECLGHVCDLVYNSGTVKS